MVLESLNSETPNIKDLSTEDLSHQEEENQLSELFDLEKVRKYCDKLFKTGEQDHAIQILSNFKIFSVAKFKDVLPDPPLNYNQIYNTLFNSFSSENNKSYVVNMLINMQLLFPDLYYSLCRQKEKFAFIDGAANTFLKNQSFVYGDRLWLKNLYQFHLLYPEEYQNETRESFSLFKERLAESSAIQKEAFCEFAKELRVVYGNQTVDREKYQALYEWFKEKVAEDINNEEAYEELGQIAANMAIISARSVEIDEKGITLSGQLFPSEKLEDDQSIPPLPETRNF